MSEQRAYRLIGADQSTIRYRRRRPNDALFRGRLRELASDRRRFGYRRLKVMLRQAGRLMNCKKTDRFDR